MKFKIGDRVAVVNRDDFGPPDLRGKKGKITYVPLAGDFVILYIVGVGSFAIGYRKLRKVSALEQLAEVV